MIKLKGSHRTYLRGLAHKLKPVIQVGRSGVSVEVLAAIDEALSCHELIKLKFMEFKEQKDELSRLIAERTASELVGRIGNMAIFYREHPEEDKRRIKLPRT